MGNVLGQILGGAFNSPKAIDNKQVETNDYSLVIFAVVAILATVIIFRTVILKK